MHNLNFYRAQARALSQPSQALAFPTPVYRVNRLTDFYRDTVVRLGRDAFPVDPISGSTSFGISLTGLLEGVGGNLEGSAGATFTPTAELTSRVAMAGLTTLADFEVNGLVTGDGELVGSSGLTFTAFIGNTAPSQIEGSATVQLSLSGSVQGLSQRTGSSTLTFSESATLTAQGALVGSSGIDLTGTGLLAESGGAAEGRINLAFAVFGVPIGRGALAGNASLSFSGLAGGGQSRIAQQLRTGGGFGQYDPYATATYLSKQTQIWQPRGNASLGLTAQGDLTDAPPGILVGQTGITFSTSMQTGAKGALLGVASIGFAPAGTIINGAATQMDGSSTLTVSPAGTAFGRGALVGTVPISFDLSGEAGGALMFGSTTISFNASADVIYKNRITGSASFSFAPVGTLLGLGDNLAGSASLSLASANADLNGRAFLQVDPIGLAFAASGDGSYGISTPSGTIPISFQVTGDLREVDDIGFDPGIIPGAGPRSVVGNGRRNVIRS